jgi:hypothetical protein
MASAAPEQRTLTFAEMKTLTVTTPVLHVVGGTPTAAWRSWIGAYTVWADYGDGQWTTVFTSGTPTADAPNNTPLQFYILLTRTPRMVRIGVTGYYSGPLYVDHIELIFPDGTRLNPARVLAVNNVQDPQSAVGADGKVATISHVAAANPALPTVVDGIDADFSNVPDKWKDAQITLPTVPAPPVRLGVYEYTGTDTDPHETLIRWRYTVDPAAVALYDFSMPQANSALLFAQVKHINPEHKIIARLTWLAVNPLDYAYDPAARQRVADSIAEQLTRGTDNLYGVYLGDEEPQHYYGGWYSDSMPDWVKKYQAQYATEVGKAFDWNSPDLRAWVISKGPQLFNDIYDQVKAVNPRLKVMPFLYVPGDVSGWGLWDLKQIKADGWVCQWYDNGPQRPMRLPVTHVAPDVTSVWVMESWFNLAVQKIRERGIPNEDIYCQVWAFQPTNNAVAEVEQARQAGLGNFWVFYYDAWIPPAPRVNLGTRDMAFRLFAVDADVPYLAQQTSDDWSAVGVGVAQRFTAEAPTLGKVAIQVQAAAADESYQVALYEEADGRPAGPALVTTPLSLPANTEGWVEVPLAAPTQVGSHYYLALLPRAAAPTDVRTGPRPEIDDQGNVKVAVTLRAPYPDGNLIHRENYPGYYDDWQTYQSPADWQSSYRQRVEFEGYLQLLRAREGR